MLNNTDKTNKFLVKAKNKLHRQIKWYYFCDNGVSIVLLNR